ncbi:aldo/keto reductase [Halobacillus andaensis]|uniref:aldo/keto reductase n=1 Tax=Halobacillus andaensis TaxID=1176239 RepID=UPI003D71A40A
MKNRRLGNTDLFVSELCFGPMKWTDVQEGKAALDHALDLGVNVVHSSYEYQTIDQLGAHLMDHPKRQDIHHIIKVSSPEYNEEKFDKKKFRSQVEEALRKLHTERIDVVQHLHRSVSKEIVYHEEGNPQRTSQFSEVQEELLEVFDDMKNEGKVNYLASFPMTPKYAELVVKSGNFHGIAGYYNLIETELTPLFPEMELKGMGYIAIRPLLAGLLTEKRKNRNKLAGQDPMRGEKWNDAYELFQEVQKTVSDQDANWEDFALKFCLADPRVTTVVMGLNNPAQVEAAVEAANGDYPAMKEVNEIIAAVAHHSKEVKTWPPY